jgi:hypothetical protein
VTELDGVFSIQLGSTKVSRGFERTWLQPRHPPIQNNPASAAEGMLDLELHIPFPLPRPNSSEAQVRREGWSTPTQSAQLHRALALGPTAGSSQSSRKSRQRETMFRMIPIGYMAKRSCEKPEGFIFPQVADIYSVNNCVNDDFADYVDYWKHNGYWFFDSPGIIQAVAHEHLIDLHGTKLFYYEVHELEFDGENWRTFSPGFGPPVTVIPPPEKQLEGFDVVTIWVENSPAPDHSPLSCNSLAEEILTNSHCLVDSFEDAERALNEGRFRGNDRGVQRIFAVYSVEWPTD